MSSNARARYSKGAMLFHWVIAIAVIANWRIAEAAEHAASDVAGSALMGNHKALGITILVLTLARLLWRFGHKAPPLPASMAQWEKLLAKTVHVIFYVLLIGLPLGGWLGTSYFGSSIDFFGLFTVPGLPVGSDPETGKAIIGLHSTGGEIMLYLIALHIVGALKHTFFDKNGGIYRMLPWGNAKGR